MAWKKPWDGLPVNPDKAGWHWVAHQLAPGSDPFPVRWADDDGGKGNFGWEADDETGDPESARRWWRYLGPVAPPPPEAQPPEGWTYFTRVYVPLGTGAEPSLAPERSAAGQVWLDLAVRHHNASRAGDDARRATLFALMDAIEAEYPKEIEAERKLWGGGT